MRKIKVAIADEDVAYLSRLQEYLERHATEQMEIQIYEDVEAYLQSEETDLALLSAKFWKVRKEKGCELFLSDGEILEEVKDKVILKYQPADEIQRELLFQWQKEQESQDIWKLYGKRKDCICIYAPGGQEYQMFYGWFLAREYAKKKKTLYIDLLECDGFDEMVSEKANLDLLSLIEMMKERQGHFATQLACVVHQEQWVDYIPPVENPAILSEIQAKEYLQLVHSILEETEYEVCILNIGAMLPGFFEILECATKIDCITTKGAVGKRQEEIFCRYLQRREADLENRVECISLRSQQIIGRDMMELREKLECQELQDIVRNRKLASDFREGGTEA